MTFAPDRTARTASSRCSTTDNATSANLGLLISDVPRNVADVKAPARANVKHQLAGEWKASPGTRQHPHGHLCRRSSCENFLYRFKAAPRGRSRRRHGRHSRAPAPLPRSWPLTPVSWREDKDGAAVPGKSRSRSGFDTGTPRGGSIGLMRAT